MNICILLSMTTLAGWLNCPFLVPSVPNLLQSLLNTQMRLLLRSATTIRPQGLQHAGPAQVSVPAPLLARLHGTAEKNICFIYAKIFINPKNIYLPTALFLSPT